MKLRHCLFISLLAMSCKSQSAPTETAPPTEPVPVASSASPQASSVNASVGTPPQSAEPAAPAVPVPADLATPPASAKKTASGLVTNVLTPGTGKEHPGPDDKVSVNYSGWTKDGKMFDSSIPRHEPASFGVSQVIKGWTEALQLMVEGEKRRVWIPSKLAYG